MARNKIKTVVVEQTPEEQANELLAEYKALVEQKREIEEERKKIEGKIVNLAVLNREQWFRDSGTATFERGRIAQVRETKFQVDKKAMNWKKFQKKYPTCVKLEFVTKSLKEFFDAEGDKISKDFGIEQLQDVVYKIS